MVWLMLLLVIVSGAVLCAQSAINGRLGAEVGVLESAWLTFALGTLISFFLLAFFFWSHPTPTPCSACRVGKWAGRFFWRDLHAGHRLCHAAHRHRRRHRRGDQRPVADELAD